MFDNLSEAIKNSSVEGESWDEALMEEFWTHEAKTRSQFIDIGLVTRPLSYERRRDPSPYAWKDALSLRQSLYDKAEKDEAHEL